MKRRTSPRLRGLVLALSLLVGWVAAAEAHPWEQIAYWRTKYSELKPTDHPRAATAHGIFQRLVQVAGKPARVEPRLFITASDPWEIALPIALPDGWIILSKGALDICYQDPARGEDRLAFVLAHELAHQLKDDFWHLRFSQAIEAAQADNPKARAFLTEVRQAARMTEQVLARELQADEHGIIYATMAGFNPQAIVTDAHGVNFFADWVLALDPQRLRGIAAGHVRPTPQERAESLRAHLRQVAGETVAFQLGLWFYYAGDYPRAVRAFDHFRTVFPSREVFHNLAVSHHQLALQAYQAWKPDIPALPFQLSLAIDPLTRASRIYLEGPKRGGTLISADPAALYRQHLDTAIAAYREAIAHDEAYIPAYLNLGSALTMRGSQTGLPGLNADMSEAVTILLRGLEHAPNTPETPAILNTLGVALFYDKRPDAAKDTLIRARTLAPTYTAPVFNLEQLAQTTSRETNTHRDGRDDPRLAVSNVSAPMAASQPLEQVMGLAIGQLTAQVPSHWGIPVQSTVRLGEEVYTVATYPAALMTLSRDGEILMLMVRGGYQGTSARGITIGHRVQDVLKHYGPPSRRVELTHGHSWSYDIPRIAFQVRNGKVVSWLVF